MDNSNHLVFIRWYNQVTNPTSTKPRILLFDIENAPSLGWFYDLWKEGNIVGTKSDQYFLSFAYKWLDERQVKSFSLPDFKGYKPGSENDELLVKELWKLFDEADIVIAHNGNSFDIKKTNARFAYYKLSPPSPYKSIDTYREAKKYLNLPSYKLDYIANYFGYGRKLAHTGFHLWKGCMSGEPSAWKHMVKYNKKDVTLLEKIYLHLRPWIKNHPNISILMDRTDGCPNCGSLSLMKQGTDITQKGRVQQFSCNDCGKWSRGKIEKVTNIS